MVVGGIEGVVDFAGGSRPRGGGARDAILHCRRSARGGGGGGGVSGSAGGAGRRGGGGRGGVVEGVGGGGGGGPPFAVNSAGFATGGVEVKSSQVNNTSAFVLARTDQ